ncbi:armadillo repeat-containing protein 4 isoform X3 [Exaiptasia diaphana]|nr:armadillo repeat-containing protein 4 isoform X3 [Exaiptasia diaphana]
MKKPKQGSNPDENKEKGKPKTDSSKKKQTEEKRKNKTNREIKRNSRREPSTKWKNLRLFDDESDEEIKPQKQTPKPKSVEKRASRRMTMIERRATIAARPESEYSESSTESDEDDERVMDGKINAADLPSEYWQIQRMVRFLKIGNPTATVLCLCALKDFNLTQEMSQMAIREVNGLQVLINLLKTDDHRCKIGSLNLLLPLTTNSKYNINTIIRLGGVPVVIELVTTGGQEIQGLAAATLANLARSSKARNILRRCGGIKKMVDLLNVEAEKGRRKQSKSHEQQTLDMEVARCAALALWSCSKSRNNRTAIFKAGSVPLLAELIKIDKEDILIPIVGLMQECAIEPRYRQAFQQEHMIEVIVRHLKTENEELQTYCANAIFKCSEDEETRQVVRQYGGLEPLVSLVSQSHNKKLLAAATGAIWKCSVSLENAERFLDYSIVESLTKFLQNPDDPQPEEVQIHIVGALSEFAKVERGRREILACKGCRTLIALSSTTNEKLVEQTSYAIAACSKDRESRDLMNNLDGLRFLWSLLKSNNPKVVASAAWGIYGLTEDSPEAWENARSFVGGLELIVTLLKSNNIEILTSTCAAISNIAKDYENIGVLTDYGVVPLLAHMTNTDNVNLRRHLAEAIARCSQWGNNAEMFCHEGAVHAMVEYLSFNDVILKRSAVRALFQLARNPESCIIMHSQGVVKSLVKMVGSRDEALQEAAAGCLLFIRKLAMANAKAQANEDNRVSSPGAG